LGGRLLESLEKARTAVKIASDKQAEDIVLLDIRRLCSFADFFVICSAQSSRQITGLCDDLGEALSGPDASLRHREGSSDSGWVLLDFGDLVVHVFSPERRRFYALEELWKAAPTLLRVQ